MNLLRVSRCLLMIALVEFLLCVILVLICFAPWSFVVIAVLIAKARTTEKPYWAYGTARWASSDDLRKAGMIGGRKGLAIGQMCSSERPPLLPRLISVADRRFTSREACDRFLSRFWQTRQSKKGETVRLAKAVHTAVFGPTGAGKGVSFIIPWLLETDESAVVLDFKGENAAITAKHRERVFGHRVVLLDPFQVVTKHPDSFNPIDFIEKDSAFGIDDCRDLSEQLVVKTGEEREPHWNEAAQMWIAAAIIAVVQHGQPDNRSLQTVRDALSDPRRIPGLLKLLDSSGALISRMGGQLGHFIDKELSSTLTTAGRQLAFLDTTAIATSTSTSSFNPMKLRDGKMTVYCILPPEHMRAQTSLIRMWIGSLMKAVVKGGLQHG